MVCSSAACGRVAKSSLICFHLCLQALDCCFGLHNLLHTWQHDGRNQHPLLSLTSSPSLSTAALQVLDCMHISWNLLHSEQLTSHVAFFTQDHRPKVLRDAAAALQTKWQRQHDEERSKTAKHQQRRTLAERLAGQKAPGSGVQTARVHIWELTGGNFLESTVLQACSRVSLLCPVLTVAS